MEDVTPCFRLCGVKEYERGNDIIAERERERVDGLMFFLTLLEMTHLKLSSKRIIIAVPYLKVFLVRENGEPLKILIVTIMQIN